MINNDLMRKKLESLRTNGKSDKKDSPWFKPAEGDQEVRFLPSEDGDPFKEYFFHYNLGESFLCPKKNFNEKCPVCDYAFELWREGTDESQKMAKTLFSRQRFFTNVLERGKEENGPKPYGYGKETYEQLLETSLDPDFGDFTDPEQGRDFKLTYKKAEKKGAFPKTKITIKPKQSPLAKSKKEIKEFLEKVKPISTLMVKKSTEEVKKILELFLNDPFAGSDDKKLGDSTSELANEEISSIDQAINELSS